MLRPTIAVMGLTLLAAACGASKPPKALPPTFDMKSLPDLAVSALNDKFPNNGWSLAALSPQVSTCLSGKPGATSLTSDFDSDGIPDLALAVKTQGGVRLIVLLGREDGYALFDLDSLGDQDAGAGLGLAKRGTSFLKTTSVTRDFYPADTLTTYVCAGAKSSYLWGGLAFYKVDLAASTKANAR